MRRQMKEQNETPEKELNEMELANLSDAEFKTLVIISMLKECMEYGQNIWEEMNVTLSEIKKIYKEPTMVRKKPRIKPMIWNTREEKAFNQNSR